MPCCRPACASGRVSHGPRKGRLAAFTVSAGFLRALVSDVGNLSGLTGPPQKQGRGIDRFALKNKDAPRNLTSAFTISGAVGSEPVSRTARRGEEMSTLSRQCRPGQQARRCAMPNRQPIPGQTGDCAGHDGVPRAETEPPPSGRTYARLSERAWSDKGHAMLRSSLPTRAPKPRARDRWRVRLSPHPPFEVRNDGIARRLFFVQQADRVVLPGTIPQPDREVVHRVPDHLSDLLRFGPRRCRGSEHAACARNRLVILGEALVGPAIKACPPKLALTKPG